MSCIPKSREQKEREKKEREEIRRILIKGLGDIYSLGTREEAREAVREVLELHKLRKEYEELVKGGREYKSQITALEQEARHKDETISKLSEQVNGMRAEREETRRGYEELKEKLDGLKNEYRALGGKVSELSEANEQKQIEIEKYKDLIKTLEQSKEEAIRAASEREKELQGKISELLALNEKLQEESGNKDEAYKILESEKKRLESELRERPTLARRLPPDLYKMAVERGHRETKEKVIHEDEGYMVLEAPDWLPGWDFRVAERIRNESRKNVVILDKSGRDDKITVAPYPYGSTHLIPLIEMIKEEHGGSINYKDNCVTFSKEHTDEVMELVKNYKSSSGY